MLTINVMISTLPHSRPDRQKRALLAEQLSIVRDCLAASRTATAKLAQALAVIHKEELYRLTHKSFEELCAQEFDLTRSRGYQLLDFAKVVEHLCANNCGHLAIPDRESHARLLAPLPPAQQIEVARRVQESLNAEGRSKPLTADFVEAIRIVNGNAVDPDLQNTETPPSLCQWIYERLIDADVHPRKILDPCAGHGNLIRPFRPMAEIIEYEIRHGLDFFQAEKIACDLVICNPPWKDALRWLMRIVEVVDNQTPTVFICPVLFFIGYKTAPCRQYLDSPEAPRLDHITPLPADTFVKVYCPAAILWLNLPEVRNTALVPSRYLIRSNLLHTTNET